MARSEKVTEGKLVTMFRHISDLEKLNKTSIIHVLCQNMLSVGFCNFWIHCTLITIHFHCKCIRRKCAFYSDSFGCVLQLQMVVGWKAKDMSKKPFGIQFKCVINIELALSCILFTPPREWFHGTKTIYFGLNSAAFFFFFLGGCCCWALYFTAHLHVLVLCSRMGNLVWSFPWLKGRYVGVMLLYCIPSVWLFSWPVCFSHSLPIGQGRKRKTSCPKPMQSALGFQLRASNYSKLYIKRKATQSSHQPQLWVCAWVTYVLGGCMRACYVDTHAELVNIFVHVR